MKASTIIDVPEVESNSIQQSKARTGSNHLSHDGDDVDAEILAAISSSKMFLDSLSHTLEYCWLNQRRPIKDVRIQTLF